MENLIQEELVKESVAIIDEIIQLLKEAEVLKEKLAKHGINIGIIK